MSKRHRVQPMPGLRPEGNWPLPVGALAKCPKCGGDHNGKPQYILKMINLTAWTGLTCANGHYWEVARADVAEGVQ